MVKRGFRCIHCGSEKTPDSAIDGDNYENKMLLNVLILMTLCSCCIGFPILFVYPFVARRKHYCKDCKIKL